jgi:hypothetical protein
MHAAGPEASHATRALVGWAAEHCAIDCPQAVANLPHAMRAVGQDDACRRLLARDPVGHGQLYQSGALSPLPG